MAHLYWGRGSILVVLTSFTAVYAVYISGVLGSSRIIFALARHRLLPHGLSQLRGALRIPRNAILFVFALILIFDAITLLGLGNSLDGFNWWTSAVVFFGTLTFTGVNLSNILLFWKSDDLEFKWLQNFIVPALGMALNLYLIYTAFFQSLWQIGMRMGQSVVLFCVGLLAVEICVVIAMRRRFPQYFSAVPPLEAG
jgi:amino acid transporter